MIAGKNSRKSSGEEWKPHVVVLGSSKPNAVHVAAAVDWPSSAKSWQPISVLSRICTTTCERRLATAVENNLLSALTALEQAPASDRALCLQADATTKACGLASVSCRVLAGHPDRELTVVFALNTDVSMLQYVLVSDWVHQSPRVCAGLPMFYLLCTSRKHVPPGLAPAFRSTRHGGSLI